jgi:predicted MFS family arabinose efflux permease
MAATLEQFGYRQEPRRSLGLLDLIVYGLVVIVPTAQMATFGIVYNQSRGMVPLVYLVGLIAMVFTALNLIMSRAFLWQVRSTPMRGEASGSPRVSYLLTADRPATRLATRLAFLVAGFGVACWAPLVPLAKETLQVDDGVLGMLLLCLGVGSVAAMLLTGVLSARYGSRPIILAGGFGLAVLPPLLVVAGSPVSLGLTLRVWRGAGLPRRRDEYSWGRGRARRS